MPLPPLVRLSDEVMAYLARGGQIKTINPMHGTSHAKPNALSIQHLGEEGIKCEALHPSSVPRGRKTLRSASSRRGWTARVVSTMRAKIEKKDLRDSLHQGKIPVSQGLGLDGNNCC